VANALVLRARLRVENSALGYKPMTGYA